ncbi:ABC transporter permease [Tsukamurella sp. 8F]|uniref:MlaE family ABC transporter permease n=1 Tax=unclassified Tsukamurella TaxID=2633480 RepID=UPI0023B9ABD2|nr:MULTISPECIES: ABC transporter permease [unclassified Tsukamurella]MDF0530309.1 ABC transporter permease [Tsukamurella sp. 8J]MDF0587606.1 ABC transporter permease [Tsukamurella sp. 8F]
MTQAAVPAKRPSAFSILRKNFSTTIVDSVRTMGRTVRMFFTTLTAMVTDTLKLQLQWKEAFFQLWYMIGVATLPAVLIAIPFGMIVSIQVGNIIHQLGADSLAGAASGLAVIAQGAPIATALLLAGAGASAIAADLGARTIREETDAMRVMGINPINRLVVPRLIAAWIVSPLLNILIIVIGTLSGYFVAVGSQGVTPGAFWLSFGSFAHPVDVWISIVKSIIFGTIVAIIGCQRGLEAKGGSRGVADGVNSTVVLSFVVIFTMNLVLTQVTTVFFPIQVG